MRHLLEKWHIVSALALAALAPASCDMMRDDLSDCPTGLYVSFRYDYNLERADMFGDHVGDVTLYVYDSSGKLAGTYRETNSAYASPLARQGYAMRITGLEPGEYRLIALAQQTPQEDGTRAAGRASFARGGVGQGDGMTALTVTLEREPAGDGEGYRIAHRGLPLDTLWHGMETEPLTVYADRPTYDTISLVRDTKQISVTLRELDDPTTMDIDNYSLAIADRNSVLLWDNSLDETDRVEYTPYVTWNDEDPTDAADGEGDRLAEAGRTGHADFMTSRILSHSSAADDAVLTIDSKETGTRVATLNLASLLARTRNYQNLYRYSAQEYLDRGYDYGLSIYLKGGKLSYVTITIGILSWDYRPQYENL